MSVRLTENAQEYTHKRTLPSLTLLLETGLS